MAELVAAPRHASWTRTLAWAGIHRSLTGSAAAVRRAGRIGQGPGPDGHGARASRRSLGPAGPAAVIIIIDLETLVCCYRCRVGQYR